MSNDRSAFIHKLLSDFETRAAYINAKVSALVPAQIRGLRLKSETPKQPELARASKMHQSRISMLETVGANPTIGTLSQIAAGLKVGLKVEFVPFSEMLTWENSFSQDAFAVVKLDDDSAFLCPQAVASQTVPYQLFYRRVPVAVAPVRAGMWRHSGIENIVFASGDFSTVSGGNVRVVNIAPPASGATFGGIATAVPVMQQEIQVSVP